MSEKRKLKVKGSFLDVFKAIKKHKDKKAQESNSGKDTSKPSDKSNKNK